MNDELHLGLTRLFPQLSADADARVAVITGEGRAFSAGGDFDLLDRMANDRALRRDVIAEGRELVLNMIRCRVPVVAAVNGPAVGLGCSVIALSDVVYMAESAYLSDPHVTVGLVAADGGPLTWPLHTSLLLAKEYAFTGDRITAARAAEIGLANHVCPDGEVLSAALAAAHKIAALPQQAVEATKRVLNLHVERAVLATIDFAMAAETESFDTPELRANVDRFLDRESAPRRSELEVEGLQAAQDVRRRVLVAARAGRTVLGLRDPDVGHAVEDPLDADRGLRRARAARRGRCGCRARTRGAGARWRGRRRNSSGCSKRRGSRLAAPLSTITVVPAGISTPPTVVGDARQAEVALDRALEAQRSPRRSSGCGRGRRGAAAGARAARRAAGARSPRRRTVVSCPAANRFAAMRTTSITSGVEPSGNVAVASPVSTSSRGSRRRSST